MDSNKDPAYNKKQVNSAITSAIIQGKSVDGIADDLQNRISTLNRNLAVKTARTAITSAQNGGKLKSLYELRDMGVEVQKEWVATLDSRTRPSHAAIDGQRRELEEAFSNGLQYPGASGSAAERYNCRCTMVSYIPDVDTSDAVRWSRNLKTNEREYVPNITYSEWLSSKNKEDASELLKSIASKIKGTKKTPVLEEEDNILESLRATEIAYNPVEKSANVSLAESDIISILSETNKVNGSCTSLALSYIGRTDGYDVTDFRGGESRAYFAKNTRTWIKSVDSLQAMVCVGKSTYEAAVEALSNVEAGKKYLLQTGKHASIVTRTQEGQLKYLDLQKEEDSGWIKFTYRMSGGVTTNETLNTRFQCNIDDRNEAILTDIENFKDNEEFVEILGYINTVND